MSHLWKRRNQETSKWFPPSNSNLEKRNGLIKEMAKRTVRRDAVQISITELIFLCRIRIMPALGFHKCT